MTRPGRNHITTPSPRPSPRGRGIKGKKNGGLRPPFFFSIENAPTLPYPNLIPWASGSSVLQLIVLVCRRM